jgi:hypothetical protein
MFFITFYQTSYFFQQTFSDVAMFFRDIYGGDKIGVVWKPDAFHATQFKVCYL